MTDDKPTVVIQPSPGVVGVATGAVDALRGSPMLLVMVLLNCVFITAAAWYLRGQQDNAFRLVDKMLEHCLPDKTGAPSDHQGLLAYPPSQLNEATR